MLITDGQVRMRWRNGMRKQKPMPPMAPGEVYEVEIDMWNVSYIVAPGHRLGLDITSSSWPAQDPNPNNGMPIHAPDRYQHNVTAHNSVHLGRSRVSLPTVSPRDLPHWHLPRIP